MEGPNEEFEAPPICLFFSFVRGSPSSSSLSAAWRALPFFSGGRRRPLACLRPQLGAGQRPMPDTGSNIGADAHGLESQGCPRGPVTPLKESRRRLLEGESEHGLAI